MKLFGRSLALTGDTSTAVEPALADEGQDPTRRADHVRALFEQTPATLTGNIMGVVVVLAMFGALAPLPQLLGWTTALLALWVLRLLHWLRYCRRRDAPPDVLLSWRRSWNALVLTQGGLWGVASWMFWGLGTPYHKLALMLVVVAYSLVSVQLLASQRATFAAFSSLVLLPAFLRIATDVSQPFYWQLATILGFLFIITLLLGDTYRGALGQAIELKAGTERLAAQLRIEKAAADEARRTAEAASHAKTQFFAAASHDLRQPLHAMGLFAEALRQRIADPEVASLVNSINESVDALEGLFAELLDITRIDTGGVEVHRQPVRMKELFARLRLTFEPAAFEKGLALSFRGERHMANSDPVLLERVLRNLVSNAIRYSEDGGVLVTCRPCGGKLKVQVWDTGIGIAAASLPRIYDEFFQVQSQRPLEAHQRKGLGLGLAIVKRLSDLLEMPITVRSEPGRGTVFTMEVPLGREKRAVEREPRASKAPLGLTLQGRCIVVVEDEAAVREGLVVLLKAWGATVHAFDSLPSIQAWLTQSQLQLPDLLIVDYRLPSGTTGLDALALLRGHWPGRELPAIVVTGSSMGGHEDEASQHDFHLLIKPVLPNKLRAMIAFKLRVR